jgi:hypothetical protein
LGDRGLGRWLAFGRETREQVEVDWRLSWPNLHFSLRPEGHPR